MTSTYQMTEDAISDTISAFNKGFYPTPTAAAKAYNIAPRTVQQRVKRMGSRSPQTSSNRALNLEQKQAKQNYLKQLDDAGISAILLCYVMQQTILLNNHILILVPLPQTSADAGLGNFSTARNSFL